MKTLLWYNAVHVKTLPQFPTNPLAESINSNGNIQSHMWASYTHPVLLVHGNTRAHFTRTRTNLQSL